VKLSEKVSGRRRYAKGLSLKEESELRGRVGRLAMVPVGIVILSGFIKALNCAAAR
jgi:hypothetical protein